MFASCHPTPDPDPRAPIPADLLRALRSQGHAKGLDPAALDREAMRRYGAPLTWLTAGQGTALMAELETA